jgi:hypothetical protein
MRNNKGYAITENNSFKGNCFISYGFAKAASKNIPSGKRLTRHVI